MQEGSSFLQRQGGALAQGVGDTHLHGVTFPELGKPCAAIPSLANSLSKIPARTGLR